jgi:hypothetical protein
VLRVRREESDVQILTGARERLRRVDLLLVA